MNPLDRYPSRLLFRYGQRVTLSHTYRHAPLALAVVEIRHPSTGYLTPGQLASLKQSLVKETPLLKEESFDEVQMVVQQNMPARANSTAKVNHRFLARDRQTSITFRPDVILVETTAYQGWEQFRGLIDTAIRARQKATELDGLERVGIRFIDELRPPKDADPSDWSPWVLSALLAPAPETVSLKPVQQQAVVQFTVEETGDDLTLRYGAVSGPSIVGSGPNLIRVNVPAPGPFFLIDTDTVWAPGDGESVPELTSALVLEIVDRLHRPLTDLFEELVTDRLRTEVFDAE